MTSMYSLITASMLGVAAMAYPPVSTAQAVVSGSQMRMESGAATEPAARIISLDLTNVTLQRAVDEISARSGVRIAYGNDAISHGPRITLHAPSITVAQALERVLAGTRFRHVVNEGQIAIIESARSPRRVVQGVIAGRVTDAKTGRGVVGASVSLDRDDQTVRTSEDGGYRLTGVSSGNHAVIVRSVGYAKQAKPVVITAGETVTTDFALEPSASVLDQIIVTGTIAEANRKEIPNAMTVITAKDIEQRGLKSIDQIFRGEVPGLFAMNVPGGTSIGSNDTYGGTLMFSRGSSQFGTNILLTASSPIKTYVDGVEMANPQFLNTIDPGNIERIEILTGPQASTVYGSGALNGVMQIFTKKGTGHKKPELTLSL